MAPPFKTVEFDLMYGQGISREGDILDIATESEIVQKSGAWYSYGDERLGQGRENAKQYLQANPEICHEIEEKFKQMLAAERDSVDETRKLDTILKLTKII